MSHIGESACETMYSPIVLGVVRNRVLKNPDIHHSNF